MTLALVGYTHSYNDQQWLAMAGTLVAEQEATSWDASSWSSARRVVFDLRGPEGVNFLDDPGEYDVVVLFAIFNPPRESAVFQRSLGKQRGQESLAANHSRDNWAQRLSATRAKYLLVFRRPDSVSGEWLGEIDGYRKEPEEAGVFGMSVYRRVG